MSVPRARSPRLRAYIDVPVPIHIAHLQVGATEIHVENDALAKLQSVEIFPNDPARGLRFRCHVRTLPGSPDIVFPRERVAIFVGGDFWHGWRLPAWEHKLTPFWRDKLRANRSRDHRNLRRLRAAGCRVIRLWQHDVQTRLPAAIVNILASLDR